MRSICGALILFTLLSSRPASAVGNVSNQDLELQMVDLVNQDRARKGLPALRHDPRLSEVARAHSQDMVTKGYFAHHSRRTGDHGDRISRAGILWSKCGENLALDSSVESAERHLMQSPGHRANILSRDYSHIGIGIVRSGRSLYATQLFLRPRGGSRLASGGRSGRRRTGGLASSLPSLLWNAISND